MSARTLRRERATRAGVAVAWLPGFLGTDAQWNAVRACDTGEGPDLLATLPGHSGEPWYPARSCFDGAVEALSGALSEALSEARLDGRNQRVVLVGYSMGARVALALALRYPEKVRAALLLGVDPGRDDALERAERRAWDEAQAKQLAIQGLARFLEDWEALPVFAPERSLEAPVRAARRAMRASHTAEGAAWALRVLGTGSMPPLGPELGSLRVPVRLLTGSLDERFTDVARTLAARHAGHRRVTHRVLEGAGHDPALFFPAEVAREVRALRGPHSDEASEDEAPKVESAP